MLSGCPKGHVVVNATTAVLTDNCDGRNDWLVPKDVELNSDPEIIIFLGCMKMLKGLQMKNIKKEQGGTKDFTIFLSESSDGPWIKVFEDMFQEQQTFGCAPMERFDIRHGASFLNHDLFYTDSFQEK